MSATSLRNTTTKSNTSEMIQSTAHTAKPASHKPRPQKKTKPEQPLAQVAIDSEPALSKHDPGYYYFYVEHLNSKRDNWTILCTEDQVSWVKEQKQNNIQLLQGTHFDNQRIKCENGTITKTILFEEFYIEEPMPDEDPPMAWTQAGNEVPVVPQPQVPSQIVSEACNLVNHWLAVRKQFESSAGLQDFNDITWKATVTAYLNS